MNLIVIAALIAASSAAKLDRSYLPPPSAKTAGGSPDSLQTPFTRSSNQGLGGLPSGSYENEFQGVVVDAANPGTRTTAGSEQSGLGASRVSYGSTDSKVGEAAFRGSLSGFRQTGQGFDQNGQSGTQGSFGVFENKSERPQAAKDRTANIVKHDSDVGAETYSYGFETDNGIAASENGVAINGVQAQGGFSYKGDDGQTYSITYTADEGGYRPQGDHLPTPPPIPDEILKSLEQNAKDEAAGLVDDGTYDAQKYNEGDNSDGDNTKTSNSQSQFGKRPGLTTFNQNQAFGKPSFNSGYTNGYRPNGNNFGQAGSRPGYQSNQFQSGFNQGASAQGLTPQRENNDISSGQLGPNQASAQAQSYGNGQASAQASTGPQFAQTNKFGSQGSFGSLSKPDSRPQSVVQPSKPQYGQNLPSINNQAPQAISSSQVDTQSFQPDAEESSSNVDSSLNQGLSAQASASTQPLSGQRPQGPFNRPSTGLSSLTSYNSGNGFGSAPNNVHTFTGQAGQSNANAFASNNEYLPPGNLAASSRPIQGSSQKPEASPAPASNQFSTSQTIGNLHSQSGQGSVGFQSNQHSSASVRPQSGFGTHTTHFNGFQQTQTLSNVSPTQFPLNVNSIAPQEPSKPQYPSLPDLSGISGQPKQAIFGFNQQPTKQPDSELTTPLEPNETYPNKEEVVQPTDSSASSFASVGSDPSNYLEQPQFGVQTIGKPSSYRPGQAQIGAAPTENQSPFSSQASAFASTSPSALTQGSIPLISSTQPQTAFPSQSFISSQSANKQPQFGQNPFSQNRPVDTQFASSTQKPIGQNGQSQGFDQSYYYNQPPKPFNTPVRPFSSKLPSAPSNQFNGVSGQYSNRPQNFPANSFPSSQPQLTQGPGSLTLAPIAPTTPTENESAQVSGTSSYYNGVTQASISPFSGAPTPTTQFSSQSNQFGSKLSQFTQPAQPAPQFSSQQTQFGSQQTQFGSKPLSQQTLSEQSQSLSSSQFSSQQNQFGSRPTQAQPAQPATQFGSQQTQFGSQQNQFEYKPSQSFVSQFNQQTAQSKPTTQFGSQQTQFGSEQTQFGIKPQQLSNEQDQPEQPIASTQFGSQQTQFVSQQTQYGVKPLSQQALAGHSQPAQPTTTTQFGSQQTQFGVKPSSQQALAGHNQPAQPTTTTQFGSQHTQFGVKPLSQQPLAEHNQPAQPTTSTQYGTQPTQFGPEQTQFAGKPLSQQPQSANNQPAQPTTSIQYGSQQTQFGSQQTQFGVKPVTQQTLSQTNQPAQPTIDTQFGYQHNQFGLKPQQSSFNQQTAPTSGQFGSLQTQFGSKPLSQLFNQPLTTTQFGSQSSQFGSKPQQSQSQFSQPQTSQSNVPKKPIGQFGQTTFQTQFSKASVESKPSSEDTSAQSTPTQQYTGELYEYNKPESVPAASSEGATGQNVASAEASVSTSQTDSSVAQIQDVSKPTFGAQATLNSQANQGFQSTQFGAQPFRPFDNGQNSQSGQTTDTKPQFPGFGKPCCQGQNAKPVQSSFGGQASGENTPSSAAFGSQTSGPFNPTTTGFVGVKPSQANQGFGKGETFGGPRNPPKFDDKTGYHY